MNQRYHSTSTYTREQETHRTGSEIPAAQRRDHKIYEARRAVAPSPHVARTPARVVGRILERCHHRRRRSSARCRGAAGVGFALKASRRSAASRGRRRRRHQALCSSAGRFPARRCERPELPCLSQSPRRNTRKVAVSSFSPLEEAAVGPLRPGVCGCRCRSRRAVLLQVWHRDIVLVLVDAQSRRRPTRTRPLRLFPISAPERRPTAPGPPPPPPREGPGCSCRRQALTHQCPLDTTL